MFPILDIAGSPRERGRLHGRFARERIQVSIAAYARLFAYCGTTWTDAQAKAVAGVAMDVVDRVMWIAPDVPSRVEFTPVPLAAHARTTASLIAAD